MIPAQWVWNSVIGKFSESSCGQGRFCLARAFYEMNKSI
jgi:hypothetical protein